MERSSISSRSVGVNVFKIPETSGRMLIVSDCHLGHFEGVAGYSSEARHFAVLHGDIAYLCVDTFAGERDASLQSIGIDSEKPLLQTGHFSRAHTKRVADGCGFQPFVPMQSGDFSQTGSPWQYRAVARMPDGIESYQIFPEMRYGAFRSDGIDFAAFTQPYAEGRGDRSYARFAAVEAHETV